MEKPAEYCKRPGYWQIERHSAHAVVLATGGYGTIYYLSTLAVQSNGSAAMQAYRKGAFFGNPSFIQIHPTCIPVLNEYQSKLTLMSESLVTMADLGSEDEKTINKSQMIFLKKIAIIS